MKFKAVDLTGRYNMDAVYVPKSRKLAAEIMALHRNMGDGIELLEEDDYDQAES